MLFEKLLFPIFCLLLVPVYFLGTVNLRNPAQTYLFVKFVAVGMVIVSVFLIFKIIREHRLIPPAERQGFKFSPLKRPLIFLGLMVVYLLFFQTLGFVIVSGIVFTVFMKILGGSWPRSLLISWGLSITVFIIFVRFFYVTLPWGLLKPLEFYLY
ncbi:MAG: tripartite tricarboxylate transporter TctB family protein [Gracilibacteraceae bacterium]|jgi:hypothetical protein|nr:tripartite tricarboxylate transporter TctB family protein [Gracilibacteraceae bacterium]